MKDRLKVLLVAPVYLPLSKKLKYAGTERIVLGLLEQQTKQHIDVTVAASGDSEVERGKLIYTTEESIWSLNKHERNTANFDVFQEEHIAFSFLHAAANDIDIIHDHSHIIGSRSYDKLKEFITTPILTTIHGDIRKEEMSKYRAWKKAQQEGRPVYLAAISRSQKNKFERELGVKVLDVAYNGIPVENFPFVDRKGKQDYLFWLGRIFADKGTDLAIKVAKATGRPLILAGEVHSPERAYYEKEVKPHITHFMPGKTFKEQEAHRNKLIKKLERGERIIERGEIMFIGPVDDRQKGILYSRAHAKLMLNRWEEPFGLTMPEAMATGTPVIGTKRGSIPEIIKDGVTGYVLPVRWLDKDKGVLDEESLVRLAAKAVEKAGTLKPYDCRRHVERHFSMRVSAKHYIDLYKIILKKERLQEKSGGFNGQITHNTRKH
jgi:glycosyltransferase involved in cell wall biosynthesis